MSVKLLDKRGHIDSNFHQVLRVRAVDGDRAIGHPIVYSISSGPDDIFSINSDTGVVYTQTLLDRESPRSSNGAFILGIQALEVGGGFNEPGARTEVTIILEVRQSINFSKSRGK